MTGWQTKAKPILPGDTVRFTALYLLNSPNQTQRRGIVRQIERVCDSTFAAVDFEDGSPLRRVNINALEAVKERRR